jgi:putative phosphoesterase
MTTNTDFIAVLSDIHGNIWALEAVLAHAKAHGASQIMTLGDHAYGPLDPRGVLDRLMGLEWPAIHLRGNQDRILWENAPSDDVQRSARYTRSCLGDAHLQWLRELPAEKTINGLFLCHGSPGCDMDYLLESASRSGVHPRSLEQIASRLAAVDQDVVLCGHSHLPACVQIPSGQLVVNPGSVGLQAFADDLPVPHVIENRSPHARYALLERNAKGWNVALHAVPYDWEAAARTAEAHQRPDWARVLRSGWV